jgi:hypothetical protein
MNFTQEQIKEILQDIANGNDGFNETLNPQTINFETSFFLLLTFLFILRVKFRF